MKTPKDRINLTTLRILEPNTGDDSRFRGFSLRISIAGSSLYQAGGSRMPLDLSEGVPYLSPGGFLRIGGGQAIVPIEKEHVCRRMSIDLNAGNRNGNDKNE